MIRKIWILLLLLLVPLFAFSLNGDGFVYPLLNEHPSYASCIQEDCQGDFDGDGIIGVEDLLIFLSEYGICD